MESAVPPSYEEATVRDHWTITAGYIDSADLCAASLVAKRWHHIFAPHLWGNPASHFGTENDRVYVALTRFKRTLPQARLVVRQLTHSLHLPPALSEIYDGPHPAWLRDVLDHLPSLQSLIVSRLPSFDHSALLALRQSAHDRTFPLRLLIAAQCPNTTSAGLAAGLLHWPNLVFLDLSYTLAARDRAVFSALPLMRGLQVLKLRQIHLRDEDIEILADAIGIHVRSLDVRNNHITDRSVRTLLSICFRPIVDLHSSDSNAIGSAAQVQDDWPSGVLPPDRYILNEFRLDDLDERFVRRLTRGVVSRLPSEDFPSTGLTHLYIANNVVTVEGVASILRSQSVHLLDAGGLDTAKAKDLGRPRSHSSAQSADLSIDLQGAEKLVPTLERYAARNLTYLRIHHALVTGKAVRVARHDLPAELPSEVSFGQELEASGAITHEMDSSASVLEMDADNPTPRYELPGDSIFTIISPAVGEAPNLPPAAYGQDIRRGSIFAPEVLASEQMAEPGKEFVGCGASGRAGVVPAINGSGSSIRGSAGPGPVFDMMGGRRQEANSLEARIAALEGQRRQLRLRAWDEPHGLAPGAVPSLHTLVLTDVPCHDPGQHVVPALQRFITDCAAEARLARQQVSLEHPRFRGTTASRILHGTRELFALRRIVLEMAPPAPRCFPPTDGSLGPGTRSSRRDPQGRGRSSTEDADSEAFWSAQENDFSFFGDEECGLPAQEPGRHFPLSPLSVKLVIPTDSLGRSSMPAVPRSNPPDDGADVVQQLAQFRRQRKDAYARAVPMGGEDVDGYWPGEVKVIRYSGSTGPSLSNADFVGRYFTSGVYR